MQIKLPSLDDIVVLVASECFAVPLNIAAGEAFVMEHYDRAWVGWGIGVPLAILGASYHWWKRLLAAPKRAWLEAQARRWWPATLVFPFAYVVGPHINPNLTLDPLYMELFAALVIGGVIGLITGRRRSQARALDTGRIAWNFDDQTTPPGFFLAMNRQGQDEPRVRRARQEHLWRPHNGIKWVYPIPFDQSAPCSSGAGSRTLSAQ
jgi:hypothetical protein